MNQEYTLHHAYIVFGQNGGVSDFQIKIAALIKNNYSLEIESSAEFHFDNLSVDNVGEIVQAARIVPRPNHARIIVVKATGLGTAAQHALLKTLEEPIPNTYICIYLSHVIPLMPTVMSRVRIVQNATNLTQEKEVKDFIKASQAERLEMTKAMLADYDKEKISKSDIINFLETAINQYKANFKGEATDARLKSVLLVETYMRDTNASLKQCLELLALSL